MVNKRFEFTEGPIRDAELASLVREINKDKGVGAHSIFLGQVRADQINGKQVSGIEYTTHEELAVSVMEQIFSESLEKFENTWLVVQHSLGVVKDGELCLLVLVAGKHRKNSLRAMEYIVERIKAELPVWGKELLGDNEHSWKVNH